MSSFVGRANADSNVGSYEGDILAGSLECIGGRRARRCGYLRSSIRPSCILVEGDETIQFGTDLQERNRVDARKKTHPHRFATHVSGEFAGFDYPEEIRPSTGHRRRQSNRRRVCVEVDPNTPYNLSMLAVEKLVEHDVEEQKQSKADGAEQNTEKILTWNPNTTAWQVLEGSDSLPALTKPEM